MTNKKAAPDETAGTAQNTTNIEQSIANYTLCQAASTYAEAGFAVLPLRPHRKEPYGALVRHGVKDATSDPEKVAWWWKVEPNANIGIRTGSGLVVVDVDPRNGGELDPTWPDTLTVATASNGWHLYYAIEGDVRTSHSAIAQGVDIKGSGGYVVAPPSVRGDGAWEWKTVVPIAAISASVFQCSPPVGKREGGHGEREYARFEPLDVIPEGQRHSELTRWGGWLRGQEYSAYEIEDLLLTINAASCTPPLPEDEVASIAEWAGGLPS